MKKYTLTIGAVTVAAIFLDQISKYFAKEFMEVSGNTGIAFGIQIPYAILLPLIVVLIIVGLILASNHLNLKNTYAQIAVGAVFGGAVSNLIDRVVHGHVVDFIEIWIWPVFNLADAFVTVGIFSVIIFYDRISKTNKHSK